jgi:surface antigen
VVLAGLLASGCSFSYQLGSLFGKDDDARPQATAASTANTANADTTGSISPTMVTEKSLADKGIREADLVAASAAASLVLADDRKDASAPWQNPATGARGTVTPIATTYTQDGFTCRNFLASYVNEKNEAWMQGEACRVHHGKWVVRAMKPWKQV